MSYQDVAHQTALRTVREPFSSYGSPVIRIQETLLSDMRVHLALDLLETKVLQPTSNKSRSTELVLMQFRMMILTQSRSRRYFSSELSTPEGRIATKERLGRC